MAKKKLGSIIRAYEDLINPVNIIKHFKTDKEFKDWARDGSIKDIEYTMERFEAAELYEHCKLLLEVKKEKQKWNIKKKNWE
tara:strand:- start:3080 stop:3325 length:246 start_codon:yes stop_codon:yes gene_type:complete